MIGGGVLVLAAMIYGSTLNRGIPYFLNLVIPIVVGGFGIGMIVVPLTVSAIAGVGFDQIGPVSPSRSCCRTSAARWVLAGHPGRHHLPHAVSGRHRPGGRNMNDAQIAALDAGYNLRPALGGRGGGGMAALRCSSATAPSRWHAQEVGTRSTPALACSRLRASVDPTR